MSAHETPASVDNEVAHNRLRSESHLEEVKAYHSAGPDTIEIGSAAAEASTPFVGQWRTLISTTNWDKGRIICGWRGSLESAGANATEYSDEAWAQLVGGVTGQHVGRLRRVFQRFGEVHVEYEGLYWSHFQAATEWNDAEMWLEGALQNKWSVSQMRGQRWEVTGQGPAPAEPADDDDIATGLRDAEDNAEPADPRPAESADAAVAEHAEVKSSEPSASTNSDADEMTDDDQETSATAAERRDGPAVKPFAELPDLPDDLADAFESFKLAILTHKLTGWAEISKADVLGVLDSLKQLAQAPADVE